MINKVVLLGNLVKDPELKAIQSKSKYYTRVIIAINRNLNLQQELKKQILFQLYFGVKRRKFYVNM